MGDPESYSGSFTMSPELFHRAVEVDTYLGYVLPRGEVRRVTMATDRQRRALADEYPLEKQKWRANAACKYVTDPDFFSSVPDERYRARAICYSKCPVRKECLQYALGTLQIMGIWGACDEYELRRTLGVNANGDPTNRARKPRCPYCLNRKLRTDDETKKIHCDKCGLHWPTVQ